jgi:small-conductance mechanosensitive channel
MAELLSGAPWGGLLILTGVAVAGALLCALLVALLSRLSRRVGREVGGWVAEHLRRPLCILAATLAARLTVPLAGLGARIEGVIEHAISIILIAGLAWLTISLSFVLDEYLHQSFLIDVSDNLRARSIHTRFRLLRRALVTVIAIIAGAAVLMTFPGARELGAGLLASAGIAGLVIGVAARPTVESLIAGVQLALTEPIRIDDVVIVEGEWGRIEEITATYVVVRIWDLRRLIVPIAHFIREPFQNWTRVSADLLCNVSVDVDYSTPVEEVRVAAGAMVEASPHWDGGFWNLQVTEAGERSIRLRVLMSAADSGAAWDMRCEIREQLVAWLQQNHPGSLPRIRAELETENVLGG